LLEDDELLTGTASSVGIIGDHYLLSSIAELLALIWVGWFRLRYTSEPFLSLNSYVWGLSTVEEVEDSRS